MVENHLAYQSFQVIFLTSIFCIVIAKCPHEYHWHKPSEEYNHHKWVEYWEPVDLCNQHMGQHQKPLIFAQKNIYETAKKTSEQYLEANMKRMIIHWDYECHQQSVRPSHSSWIAMTSCHGSPLTSSAPNSVCWQAYNTLPRISGKPLYKNLHPGLLLHFWKQWEDLVTILAQHECNRKILLCKNKNDEWKQTLKPPHMSKYMATDVHMSGSRLMVY
jgi:hypothetical protein